jgi:crotonobetainyl-CoA:carnitine CoA-transferase CaiB-like acyl-CoA transferase
MGPLTGLKVIDLTHVMAGPTCTLMLADMGAEVIKIEKAPSGDDTRHMIPPKVGEEAAAFLMMNRNKRGIVLDLKTEGGKKILWRLIATADVLVENFAPGVMERLGFGYDELRKDYPSLIYCSLSGFGRTGPYKHRRGFDLVAQAMSGIMSFTGESPYGPPVKCGAPLSDITAGILAAMGILAVYALLAQGARGQRRPLWSGLQHAAGARRCADARTRNGRRGRAFGTRSRQDDRPPREVLGNTRQGAHWRAALRRAHTPSIARMRI